MTAKLPVSQRLIFFFFKQKTAYEISACLVGHGAMNASIVCQIKDIPVKDFWSVKMKNAELVRLL